MLDALKVRWSQGRQYIVDLRGATPRGFRGPPAFRDVDCEGGCRACADGCPAQAISIVPLAVDLGRCVLCGACAEACPAGKIRMTAEHRLAASARENLVVGVGQEGLPPVEVADGLRRVFGRSLKLRSVSTGGCAACELELNALGNVNFDLGRYGIEFVASPRHADALVLSGPLTRNMREALDLAWAGMPDPKFVIAVGACAISGGLYREAEALDRAFLDRFTPNLWVPGCPPHPLTFVCGIMDLLGIDLPPRARAHAPADRSGVALGGPGAARDREGAALASRASAAESLLRAVGCDPGLQRKEPPSPEERRRGLVVVPGRPDRGK
jgi:Ni,Fe-hydrogenase III small subunit/ferredoxin